MEFINNNGLELLTEVIQPNEMTRFFFILDPNGLKVQFIEQKNKV